MRFITELARVVTRTTLKAGIPPKTNLSELMIILEIILASCSEHQTSVGRIAKALDMPRSTVSTFVTELISLGWVEEEIHPEDRRRRILTVTDSAGYAIQGWTKRLLKHACSCGSSRSRDCAA